METNIKNVKDIVYVFYHDSGVGVFSPYNKQ